jgi:hypothetical protein
MRSEIKQLRDVVGECHTHNRVGWGEIYAHARHHCERLLLASLEQEETDERLHHIGQAFVRHQPMLSKYRCEFFFYVKEAVKYELRARRQIGNIPPPLFWPGDQPMNL